MFLTADELRELTGRMAIANQSAACDALYQTAEEKAARRSKFAKQRDELLAALDKIAGYRLSEFMGPHDMALACVAVAKEAIANAKLESSNGR